VKYWKNIAANFYRGSDKKVHASRVGTQAFLRIARGTIYFAGRREDIIHT